MYKIRRNIFETNSSSTHSITICQKETYDKWRSGEVYYNPWREDGDVEGQFFSKDKVLEHLDEDFTIDELKDMESKYPDQFFEMLSEEEFATHDMFTDDDYLEFYKEEYTSKSGDEIVVFGKYGYDG